MTTETETLPELEAPSQWPPVLHLVHKKDLPVKDGTIALCGEKLMGINVPGNPATTQVCKKCAEIRRKVLGQ